MRRVTYLVCALLGVLAAVSIAFLPAGTNLDSVTGTSYFPSVSGSTSQFNVLNPGDATATCEITYTNTLGVVVKTVAYTLDPKKETQIDVSRDAGTSFKGSAVVKWQGQKKLGIGLFNRSGTGPGNNSPGIKTPSTTWVNTYGRNQETSMQEYFTYLYVQNPNLQDVNCIARFYGGAGKIGENSATIAAGNLWYLPGYQYPGPNTNYATVVTANQPVNVVTTQYSYTPHGSSSHTAPFQMTPGTKYYYPGSPLGSLYEGYTNFQVFNGDPNTAHVSTYYWKLDETQGTNETTIAPYTTKTISQSDLPKYNGGSVVINSDKPLFLSNTYYWRVDEVEGNSQTNGAKEAWQLFEYTGGQTGNGFNTYINILNPNTFPITGTANFFRTTGGDPNSLNFQVPANGYKVLDASQAIPTGTFGTLIQTASPSQGIIASQHLFWGNKKYGSVDFGEGFNEPITLLVAPSEFTFYERLGNTLVISLYDIQIAFSPSASLGWTATSSAPWLRLESSGSGTTSLEVSADSSNLRRGTHEATITITAPGAIGSPKTVKVKLILF